MYCVYSHSFTPTECGEGSEPSTTENPDQSTPKVFKSIHSNGINQCNLKPKGKNKFTTKILINPLQ